MNESTVYELWCNSSLYFSSSDIAKIKDAIRTFKLYEENANASIEVVKVVSTRTRVSLEDL